MAKRHGKATKVSVKRGNDFLSIFILIVLLFVFASLRFSGFLTGSAVSEVRVGNEIWRVNSCSVESAEDTALELKWNYGCGANYCREAAYGISLPHNNVVDLSCATSDQRSKWEGYCSEIFEAVC